MRYFIIFGIVTFNGELNKPDFYNKLNYFSACKELGFLSLSIAKGGGVLFLVEKLMMHKNHQ